MNTLRRLPLGAPAVLLVPCGENCRFLPLGDIRQFLDMIGYCLTWESDRLGNLLLRGLQCYLVPCGENARFPPVGKILTLIAWAEAFKKLCEIRGVRAVANTIEAWPAPAIDSGPGRG